MNVSMAEIAIYFLAIAAATCIIYGLTLDPILGLILVTFGAGLSFIGALLTGFLLWRTSRP